MLNPCNVVAQLVTAQPVTVDLTTDVLGASRIVSSRVHSALAAVFRGFPLLHGSGAGYPGIVVYSWYWDIKWRWHLLKKLRC